MTEVSPSPQVGGTTCTYAYFLGSSIPVGVQNVAVDHTASGQGKRMVVFAVTAAADTEVADADGVSGAAIDDPSVTLNTGSDNTFIALVARLWNNTTANCFSRDGFTSNPKARRRTPERSGVFYRGTSIFTGGDVVRRP